MGLSLEQKQQIVRNRRNLLISMEQVASWHLPATAGAHRDCAELCVACTLCGPDLCSSGPPIWLLR